MFTLDITTQKTDRLSTRLALMFPKEATCWRFRAHSTSIQLYVLMFSTVQHLRISGNVIIPSLDTYFSFCSAQDYCHQKRTKGESSQLGGRLVQQRQHCAVPARYDSTRSHILLYRKTTNWALNDVHDLYAFPSPGCTHQTILG